MKMKHMKVYLSGAVNGAVEADKNCVFDIYSALASFRNKDWGLVFDGDKSCQKYLDTGTSHMGIYNTSMGHIVIVGDEDQVEICFADE